MHSKKPNRLIHSTSPYLLQHAYNPVDWYEWGKEALEKSKKEDKPILVSIGYSSCHWCHVMERESFENEDVASIMNEFFVCIKVDREERPDIDHIYMDAVQAMGSNGGWPLNVFLTADQKPFYGGTYFPSKTWVQVLTNINNAYQTKKDEIVSSAEDLANHLTKQGINQFRQKAKEDHRTSLNITYQHLEGKFDRTSGGLDKAPKFIMPSIWLWLLRYWYISKNEEALQHTLFTLKKIARGGIYDQVGGGFSRYSVDAFWFAPHFEKMLYDNAQLLSLYAEAYCISKDNFFKKIVYETIEWLQREMTHPDGGFYSALDADSEGVEGKFYTWTYAELRAIAGDDHADLIGEYFETTINGNWEDGINILTQKEDIEALLVKHSISKEELDILISTVKEKLLQRRNKRIRPGLDDKILTGWNAMTISGLVDASHVFGDEQFLVLAKRNVLFLQNNLMDGPKLFRSFKGKKSDTEGFLEDYAYLIQAHIKLYQADFDETHLRQAEKLTEYVLANFLDKKESFFYFTSAQSEKLIATKKEIFDNVIPSSNGVMVQNLYHLGSILDREEWKELAMAMATELSHLIYTEPNFMSNWGIVLAEMENGLAEVAFVGNDYLKLKNDFRKHYQPFSLLMGAEKSSSLPLLQDKVTGGDTSLIYVCYNKTCKLPVDSVLAAFDQLR